MQIPVTGRVPVRQHPEDAGADLTSVDSVTIAPGELAEIHTGTTVALPEGTVGLVIVRSSLGFVHGVSLANGVGVIDAGYRGELRVKLVNQSSEQYRVNAGDRVAQLLVVPVHLCDFVAVESLEGSDRGRGGFGSTGA